MTKIRKRRFTGAHGNQLAGVDFGPTDGHPVILLHGGGQTRHAWGGTAISLEQAGFHAICVDQRGHGDSAWDPHGRYQFADFAADLACVSRQVQEENGNRPVAVGASLGGIAAMLVAGEIDRNLLSGVVLVDITPRVAANGLDRITGFMRAHAAEGFATLEEAADAIAAYLPHRNRPKSISGLEKNLRRAENGRYVWHWDPRFLNGRQSIETMDADVQRRLDNAVKRIDVPLMLVRGSRSELVHDGNVADFVRIAPHAEVTDVRGSGHMVAGDRNDLFSDAVSDFLKRHFHPFSTC